MSCCNDCASGHGNCGSGLGSVPQQMPGIDAGAPFQFGANFELLGACQADIADFAGWIESAGLSYNTVSYQVSGSFVNPYWTIEGNAKNAWASGSDLGNAIYNVMVSRGCAVDAGSIQFRAQPSAQQQGQPPAWSGSPYPAPGATSGGECNFNLQNFPDWLACELGVTPTVALTIGVIGALGLVVLLKR
jgi:hypothetical protein